jgi:hypothetical protein
MAGLKLMSQGGYNPKIAAHLLDEATGQRAINTKVYSGDLRSWFKPKAVNPSFSCIENGQTIYKSVDEDSDNRWLVWDSNVWVARSPLIDETLPAGSNIFYTENLTLKKTNATLAGDSINNGQPPLDWYYGGVQAPMTALTPTRVGGGSVTETRVYVYTFVETFGGTEQESAPSPPSALVDWAVTNTIDLTNFDDPFAYPNTNITKIRIYRSVTSAGGNPTFLLVDEINASSLLPTPSAHVYNDAVDVEDLGEVLPSLDWLEPPDMSGVVFHPGGFLIGWHRREIIISEVNAPHAYPLAYRQTIDFDIVGMGVYGNSVAVMTKGYPYVMSGNLPEMMTPEKLASLEPCISERSITSDDMGVMYASPNGICMIGSGSGGLATGNLFTRDEFSKFNPATIRSAVYNGKYFAFYQQGSQHPLPSGGVILDRAIPSNPLSLTSVTASATYVDPVTAKMYYLDDITIYEWEGDILNNFPFEWLSKRFIFDMPTNLAAVEIGADFISAEASEQAEAARQEIIQINQEIWASGAPLNSPINTAVINKYDLNGSILQNIPSLIDDRFVQFALYAEKNGEMVEVHNDVYNQNGVYRLPSGLKSQKFEILLAGNLELRYVKMASSMKELARLE